MFYPLLIAGATVTLMIVSVLFKPYVKVGRAKIGLYWLVCLIGGIFMLCFGGISVKSAIADITSPSAVNPLKILALFLSMTLLSVYLGDAGFFYVVADKVFSKHSNGGKKLFIILYLTVSILTVFTSNDIVILTFTPPICIFAKKAKISPLPFLIGEFVAANTWSMALVIGNPTNIYLAQTAGITFWKYFSVMWLPTLLGGLAGLGVLLALFNRALSQKPQTQAERGRVAKADKPAMVVALVALVLAIVLLSISDVINVESWIICVSLAGGLTVFNFIYGLMRYKTPIRVLLSIKKAPYELIPFVLSMFIIVSGLEKCGFIEYLTNLLITDTKVDALSFGFLSAGSANLLNNIPMSVLFEKIINGNCQTIYALYGAIIGSNVGAFITPVGALAGIMWNKILSDYDVKLPFRKFVLYGVTVALPTLALSTLTLMIF